MNVCNYDVAKVEKLSEPGFTDHADSAGISMYDQVKKKKKKCSKNQYICLHS